ncbi:DUF7424 family protein [Campylobacter concisus]|jgi:hypothetical protein|uniref:DUF7424 family protein n=1 Tax=Campylobacter concisus TaxID=199 RepID=UPI000CD98F7C|nr:hypothetical protein [Campylobacter concisus]
MNKFLLLVLIGFLFAGCKTAVLTEVPLSTLNADNQARTAILNIEVPGCNSYEDSRQESKALIDLKLKIPQVFNGAQFKECYKVKMDSVASFVIPVYFGKNVLETEIQGAELKIGKDQNNNLLVVATRGLRDKIENFQKQSISKFDFFVMFKVVNDTGAEVKNLIAESAFIDDTPTYYIDFNMPKDSSVVIRLNDVATNILTQKGDNNGVALILRLPKN